MNKYSRNEVYEKTLEYFRGDELSANVWINKYALKNSNGDIYELSPEDMHRRIAKELHRIESKYPNSIPEEEIYELLKDFKFLIPGGSPMAGIGNNLQIVSLSNCFVIGDIQDSYGSIMKIDEEQVQLMKRRGGVGHDLSHLRPNGMSVKNSALTSSGAVSFMNRYSNSTREVGQDGRRGALMLSMIVNHPDIEGFIDAKLTEGKITGANISVKITDEFMKAVIDNKMYKLQFPISSKNPSYEKDLDAKALWDKIIHNAWKSAEPGVLFWDTIVKESVPDLYAEHGFATVSTNPCGEIPLCPYDSCRLLSINLYSYVDNPFTKDAKFNYERFKKHVDRAARIMDDIIDLEIEKINQILEKIDKDPENDAVKNVERDLWQKIKEKAIKGRRTGLGVTAEGDMLAALGMQYGTRKATEFSVNVHKILAKTAYITSIIMADERGCFDIWNLENEYDGNGFKNPFLKRVLNDLPNEIFEKYRKTGRRNISQLTIAPTGTGSLLSQTTSGIEPVFKVSYKRRRKINTNDKDSKLAYTDATGDSWEEYNVMHPKFIKWLKFNGYDIDEVKKMPEKKLEKIIEVSPYFKASSGDVDWKEKVYMQGQIQKWVDHSISVTINLPEETTEELVSELYMLGWKNGCKGITVYREGSRDGVLISNQEKEEKELVAIIRENHAPKRPKEVECNVIKFRNNKEEWIGFLGLLDGKPYEIFTGKIDAFPVPGYVEHGKIIKIKDNGNGSRYDFVYTDKDGYHVTMEGLNRTFVEEYWNYAKMTSGLLRHGMPIHNLIDLLNSLKIFGDHFGTWKIGVIRLLKQYIKDGTRSKDECPECKTKSLIYQSGCVTCRNCGYSACN